jgi:hypothetical protein
MSPKQIVRYMFEVVLPSPDLNGVERLVDPSFVDHDPAVQGRAHGIDSLRATHAYLHARTGGQLRFVIEDIVEERDTVAVRWSLGSTHAIAWFKLREGRLTDRWAVIRGPDQGATRR